MRDRRSGARGLLLAMADGEVVAAGAILAAQQP
jgi:ribosomal protein L27